jgi:integrase
MTSVKIVFFTSKTLSNGTHPVMIRLTKDRKAKYISTGLNLKPEQWDEETNEPKKKIPNSKEIRLKLLKARADMEKIILNQDNENLSFTLNDLAKIYQGIASNISVNKFIDTIVDEFVKSGRIGNSKPYKALKSMLKSSTQDRDLSFQDINALFLQKLELYFRSKNYKDTSVSYYMRTLRSLYNKAIQHKCAKEKDYPFKDFRLGKYNTKTVHRAITKDDIHSIINLEIKEGTRQFNSRNYFIFSYLTRGINFKDLALLKWENIKKDRLNYQRSKTRSVHSIKLLPEAMKILDYYKNFNTTTPSPYIFPILSNEHKTPVSIDNRIHKLLGQTNLDLKIIGESAKIETTLTTYVARHSYATSLRKAGHKTAIISEGLGHGAERTTEIYLDGFGNDVLDEAEKDLL